MKRHFSRAFFFVFILGICAQAWGQVRLNELMAVNDDTVADQEGEYDDWLELVNASADAVNLSGYHMGGFREGQVVDPETGWRLPPIVLEAGGRVIVWADGDTTQGALHADFRLSGAGESVVLWDSHGAVIDSFAFGALAADRSYARVPDLVGPWQVAAQASPGEMNPSMPWRRRSSLSGYQLMGLILLGLGAVFVFAKKVGLPGPSPGVQAQEEVGRLAGSIDSMAYALDRATAALGRERERLGTIVEGMLEGVVALDESNQVTLANGRFQQYLGLEDSPVGRALADCAPIPEILAAVADARQQSTAADQGDPVASRVEFDLPGPNSRRVLARAVPIRDTGGVVMVIRDLTELRHLESVRRDFVANVSHELRTPVSVIRANAETLVDGALEDRDDAEAFAGAILSNAERLSALIADLLDLSRLEAGSYRLDRAPVEVGGVVARVMELCSERAAAHNIECRDDIGSDSVVMGDARSMEQILFNLVDNAVKYNSDGGRVVVRSIRDGDVVRIEVEDDGAGISEEHRARVFERFYRVDTGRSRELGGTGLGLAIVKHLVESMGGVVGVRSIEPHGAVFWVDLDAGA